MRITPLSRTIFKARNSDNTQTIAQALAKVVATVINIKDKNAVDEGQITRIVNNYNRKYSYIKPDEVVLAFELNESLDLGEYHKHYENFSVNYFCKVMESYKLKRASANIEMKLFAPERQVESSEEERQQDRRDIIRDMLDEIESGKDIFMPETKYLVLKKEGLAPEINKDERAKMWREAKVNGAHISAEIQQKNREKVRSSVNLPLAISGDESEFYARQSLAEMYIKRVDLDKVREFLKK